MTIKELIRKLQEYPREDAEIFMSNDSEGNEIKTIDTIASIELDKSNNDGTYDAFVIFPTDTVINQ
jgi:hypothetical protein